MTHEIATRNLPNPLKNKVVHADIRIQSIEDEPKHDGSYPESDTRVVQSAPNEEDTEYQQKAAEMQMWWEEAIGRNMDLPEGYDKVAVLLIKWADELDELKTAAEVSSPHSRFHTLDSNKMLRPKNSRRSSGPASTTSPGPSN